MLNIISYIKKYVENKLIYEASLAVLHIVELKGNSNEKRKTWDYIPIHIQTAALFNKSAKFKPTI